MDLLSEIKFAKKHFDFIEITLERDFSGYTEENLKKIKKALGSFEIIGHLHWDIDLTKPGEIKDVIETIKIYQFLKAKKIIIHLSTNKLLTEKEIKKRNLHALNEITKFVQGKSIKIMIENDDSSPFNTLANLDYFVKKIKNLSLALDIGHANFKNKNGYLKFIEYFGQKIEHIHLHETSILGTHLAFSSQKRLDQILSSLEKIKKPLTMTLEVFPKEEKKRREIILDQLKRVKKAVSRD
jgi:sugar phosphate isomerase/epimerase